MTRFKPKQKHYIRFASFDRSGSDKSRCAHMTMERYAIDDALLVQHKKPHVSQDLLWFEIFGGIGAKPHGRVTKKRAGYPTVKFVSDRYAYPLEFAREADAVSPRPSYPDAKVIISSDVEPFCEAHGLKNELEKAIEIAKKCFVSMTELKVSIEKDPDCDDEWVSINCKCFGDWKSIVTSHQYYVTEWIKHVTGLKRFKVRLTYSID